MLQQFPLEKAYVIDEARLGAMDGIFKRTDALSGARNQHISLFQRELLAMLRQILQKHLSMLMILLISLCLLTSCATVPVQPLAQNRFLSWETRAQTLSRIQQWNISGIMALRTPQNAISTNWQWQQQNKDRYTILLFGPLGVGSIKLTRIPGNILLETPDGRKSIATTPEQLLKEQLGWQIPVSYLYYWIRGLPVPTLPAELQWDAYYHVTRLVQQNWIIQYLDYVSVKNIDVPSKIFLTHPQLQVKIIINQWNL